MTRWEALVQFDDEIREAAARLLPFGSVWVDKLGDAFFALHEDRRYLPNIVARLTAEAELAAREAALAAQEAERVAALKWLAAVSETASGEKTSKPALAVLIELRARGFQVAKDGAGAITVEGSGGTLFAYSNSDILRLGEIWIKNDPR